MYTLPTYKVRAMVLWTRYETILFFAIGAFWAAIIFLLDLYWLKIPWTPLALIGTAVAFVIGFQNNSAYGRIWEARKIWGGIVNTSRTFGIMVQDVVTNEHAREKLGEAELREEVRILTYRHIAWMTALRHAMRAGRTWETTFQHRTNQEWGLLPPERITSLHDDLLMYLSDADLEYTMNLNNKQTAIMYLQSHHLRELKEKGIIWEFAFLELENVLKELVALQGKSERIKNFPYPRQYASLNFFFMWAFVLLLPLALMPQFAEIGANMAEHNKMVSNFFIWLSVPFYAAVAWIFHTMERIGRTGENPFEGTSNDVPISTIARGIEIDLRQNLGESDDDIPKQFEMHYDVQF